MKEVLKIDEFDQHYMHTAFEEIGEKIPLAINAAMAKTAERKAWLDTSDAAKVKVTQKGINFVKHDLPRVAKAKP